MTMLVVCPSCGATESIYLDPSMVDQFDLDDEVIHTLCNNCKENGEAA